MQMYLGLRGEERGAPEASPPPPPNLYSQRSRAAPESERDRMSYQMGLVLYLTIRELLTFKDIRIQRGCFP